MTLFGRLAVLALASYAAAPAPVSAAQQDGAPYPNRLMRLIVPFGPGSTTDLMARTVRQKLSERWGQTVIVENRAGAGGNIGAEAVARAPADGYTLLVGAASTIINPSLYKKLRFDSLKDLAPVTNIATVTNVLVVNPDLPAKTVTELIALSKKRQITFGPAAWAARSISRANCSNCSPASRCCTSRTTAAPPPCPTCSLAAPT